MEKKANEILELKTTIFKIQNSLYGLNKLETAKERFSDIEDRSKRFNTKKDSKKANRNLKSRSRERSQVQENIYTV